MFHSYVTVYQAGYLATIGKDIEMDYAPLEDRIHSWLGDVQWKHLMTHVGPLSTTAELVQHKHLPSSSAKSELEKRQLAEYSRVSGSDIAERLDQSFFS